MAMTGNFWGTFDVVLALGVLTLVWLAFILLGELRIRVHGRRLVRRLTSDNRRAAGLGTLRHKLR